MSGAQEPQWMVLPRRVDVKVINGIPVEQGPQQNTQAPQQNAQAPQQNTQPPNQASQEGMYNQQRRGFHGQSPTAMDPRSFAPGQPYKQGQKTGNADPNTIALAYLLQQHQNGGLPANANALVMAALQASVQQSSQSSGQLHQQSFNAHAYATTPSTADAGNTTDLMLGRSSVKPSNGTATHAWAPHGGNSSQPSRQHGDPRPSSGIYTTNATGQDTQFGNQSRPIYRTPNPPTFANSGHMQGGLSTSGMHPASGASPDDCNRSFIEKCQHHLREYSGMLTLGPSTSLVSNGDITAGGPQHLKPIQKKTKVRSRRGPRSSSSPYRGVTCYRRTGRFESHIWEGGKQLHLGSFVLPEEAAQAYDRAAIKFRGQEAELNFPLDQYKNDPILSMAAGISSKEDFVLLLRRETARMKTRPPSKNKLESSHDYAAATTSVAMNATAPARPPQETAPLAIADDAVTQRHRDAATSRLPVDWKEGRAGKPEMGLQSSKLHRSCWDCVAEVSITGCEEKLSIPLGTYQSKTLGLVAHDLVLLFAARALQMNQLPFSGQEHLCWSKFAPPGDLPQKLNFEISSYLRILETAEASEDGENAKGSSLKNTILELCVGLANHNKDPLCVEDLSKLYHIVNALAGDPRKALERLRMLGIHQLPPPQASPDASPSNTPGSSKECLSGEGTEGRVAEATTQAAGDENSDVHKAQPQPPNASEKREQQLFGTTVQIP